MKNVIASFALALTLAAAPTFAGINYNSSKSNSGNVTDQKRPPDGAAKGQATEKTVAPPTSQPPASQPMTSQPKDTPHGAGTGRRQY